MRFGPEDMSPPPEHDIERQRAADKALPAQLQVNQSGAWRGVLVFDAGQVPDEFLQAAEDLVRLSGGDATMRIVLCEQSGSGAYKPTHTVLMTWSRKTGWVKK